MSENINNFFTELDKYKQFFTTDNDVDLFYKYDTNFQEGGQKKESVTLTPVKLETETTITGFNNTPAVAINVAPVETKTTTFATDPLSSPISPNVVKAFGTTETNISVVAPPTAPNVPPMVAPTVLPDPTSSPVDQNLTLGMTPDQNQFSADLQATLPSTPSPSNIGNVLVPQETSIVDTTPIDSELELHMTEESPPYPDYEEKPSEFTTAMIPAGTPLFHGSNARTINPKLINTSNGRRLMAFFSPNEDLAADHISNCSFTNPSGFVHKFAAKNDIKNIFVITNYQFQDDWTMEKITEKFCNQIDNEYKKQINGFAVYYPSDEMVTTYKVEYALCPNIIENDLEYYTTRTCMGLRNMSSEYNQTLDTNNF